MDFSAVRQKMVQEQLIERGIKDSRVLQAFQKVPRHKFVPARYLDSAYGDFPLPIGAGQTISQPYMAALMTQCLELSAAESVLEIGTGCGYQSAILAELADCVYSLERVAKLAEKAGRVLTELGHCNVHIKIADGTMGWPKPAPYDKIIVTAAAPEVPRPLIEQLKPEGKLLIPLGGNLSQVLTAVKRYKNKIKTEAICGCVFVPLLGKYGWKEKDA